MPAADAERALRNKQMEMIMRRILALMVLALTVSAAAPAFANTYADCNTAPRSEWAQCVFDQAAEHDG